MGQIRLRSALPREAGEITALARRSKGYWGYARDILDRMRDMLAMNADQIRDGLVVVAERDRLCSVTTSWAVNRQMAN
jgi:hypothetical protein